MWLHSLKVAQLLRSAACLHTNQSRSYLNHLVFYKFSLSYPHYFPHNLTLVQFTTSFCPNSTISDIIYAAKSLYPPPSFEFYPKTRSRGDIFISVVLFHQMEFQQASMIHFVLYVCSHFESLFTIWTFTFHCCLIKN